MLIEVSNGEIVDKITILHIKQKNIKDKDKLINIKKELEHLEKLISFLYIKEKDYEELLRINESLWHIENALRECEEKGKFDEFFIALARSVYTLNDERARMKKTINQYTHSEFVEEKSY